MKYVSVVLGGPRDRWLRVCPNIPRGYAYGHFYGRQRAFMAPNFGITPGSNSDGNSHGYSYGSW